MEISGGIMNKKILFILFLLLFTTGCKADYTIKIYDGTIEESLTVTEKNMAKAEIMDDMEMSFKDYALEYSAAESIYTSHYNMYADNREDCVITPDNNCEFYESSYINEKSLVGFSLVGNFLFDNYVDSTIPNDFVPGFTSSYDGKYLKISGGTDWNFLKSYPLLDEIKINVDTNYEVVSTNAVKESDGEYYWRVDKFNYNKFPEIYMILDTSIVNNNSNFKIILFIILGIVVLLGIYMFMKMSEKRRKNNRI